MCTCFRHTRKDFPTNSFLSFFLFCFSSLEFTRLSRLARNTILPSQLSTLFTRLPLTTSRCLTRVWIGNFIRQDSLRTMYGNEKSGGHRERKRLIRRALIEWGRGGKVIGRGGKRARELQIECGRDNCSRDVTAFIKSTPRVLFQPLPNHRPAPTSNKHEAFLRLRQSTLS